MHCYDPKAKTPNVSPQKFIFMTRIVFHALFADVKYENGLSVPSHRAAL